MRKEKADSCDGMKEKEKKAAIPPPADIYVPRCRTHRPPGSTRVKTKTEGERMGAPLVSAFTNATGVHSEFVNFPSVELLLFAVGLGKFQLTANSNRALTESKF